MPRKPTGPRLVTNEFGIWQIVTCERGRTRRVSTRTADRRAAELVLANLLSGAAYEGLAAKEKAPGLTVRDLGEAYIAARDESYTSRDITRTFRTFLNPFFGDMQAGEVTSAVVKEYVRKRRKDGVSDSTILRNLSILRAALKLAAREEKIAETDVKVWELPKPSPPRDVWIDAAQMDHLLATAKRFREEGALSKPRDKISPHELFLWLACETGARAGAIMDLDWSRVDLRRGLIDFRNPSRRECKKRRAVVPISDRLLPILRQAHAESGGKGRVAGYADYRTMFMFVERIARGAELPQVTPHVLRHSFASNAAMAGVPLQEIARILGNTLAMVEKVYAKFVPDYLRSGVNWRNRLPPVGLGGSAPVSGVTPGSGASGVDLQSSTDR